MDLYKLFKNDEWKQSRRRILVIRDGLIGDTVFITPLLVKLSGIFPNAEIDVVCGNKSPEVLNNFSMINKIYRLPKKFSIIKHLLLFLPMRFGRYDIAFVQEVNSHYVLMAKISGAKILIGYNNKLGNLLDFKIERKGHAVTAEQQHINELTGDKPSGALLITSSEEDREAENYLLQKGLNPDKSTYCFQVTCSEPNSVREWVPEKWAQLGDEIIEKLNGQIVFNGTESDIPLIDSIRNKMKHDSVSIAGKSGIRMLISVIKKMEMVIGVDTGTLHISNAVGVPVIMLMGYSVPDDTGPFDPSGISEVLTGSLPCIPCRYKDPKPAQWEYCVKNRPVSCMDDISVSEVMNAVGRITQKTKSNKKHQPNPFSKTRS